jgi:sec-independent protein translocase protein TatC
MSQQQEEMSFWDHLEALRWTLFRCVVALIVFTITGFVFMQYIFDAVILAPTRADFVLYRVLCKLTMSIPLMPDFCDDTYLVKIFNVKLVSPFFISMSTAFWLALLITFPYLVYEVWKFIRPALYDYEKKNVRWAFFLGTIMFFIGCAVGYFFVFPMTLRFLATYNISDAIENQSSLESYIDMFIMLIFIMGIVFEMPLISWLFSKMGLLTRSFFNKYRHHAIAGLLIAAAFITPSSDPFTLGCVFFPLYGLYELSAFFVKKAPKEEDDDIGTEVAKYEE